MTKLFNYDPYFDDFDEDKNFMRVLFRPGYGVQARELTQLQTILSNQIEKFGNHIFKSGSPITGGKISLDDRAYYLILEPQYSSVDVIVENFLDKIIVGYNTSKLVRAKVIAVDNSGVNLILTVKYLSGDFFEESDELKVYGQELYAQVKPTNSVGRSYVASIQDGVYYFKGQFVKVNPQYLVLEQFYRIGLNTTTVNVQPSYRVGIEFEEIVIDEIDDVSLLDPAQGSFNYQAPGATRFKINTTLSKRTLDSADESSFIEVIRLVDGVKTKEIDYPIYSEIEKTLARRTYEESGNYTVDPFVLSLEEGYVQTANNDYVDPNTFSAVLDPGKAYVGGYEVKTIAPTRLELNRARVTSSVSDYDLPTNYSSYLVANTVGGTLAISEFPLLDVHCVEPADIDSSTPAAYSSSKIGTLRANMMKYYSTADALDVGSDHKFTINVFDVTSTTISGAVGSGCSTTHIVLPASFAQLPVDSYVGLYFSITVGAGLTVSPIQISDSSGSAKTLELSEALPFTPTSGMTFTIQSDFKRAKSITNSDVSFSAIIDPATRTATTIQGLSTYDSFIKEPNRQGLIFDVPYDSIKDGTISNMDLYVRKVYSGIVSNGDGDATISPTTGDTFPFLTGTPGTLSDLTILNNMICFIKSGSASSSDDDIFPGQICSLANSAITVSDSGSGSININFADVAGVQADLIILTKINNAEDGSTGAVRRKTLYPKYDISHELVARTVDSSTGLSQGSDLENGDEGTRTAITGGWVFPDIGCVVFDNENEGDEGTVRKLKTPGVPVSLKVPDVYEIVKIIDSRTGSANVTTSMLTDPLYDVTDRYELDTGQRNTHYDHASIRLKRGYSSPIGGSIYVQFKYLRHTAAPSPQNLGLFTVDSYIDPTSNLTYGEITKFLDKTNSKLLSGRSSFDFRPTRAINSDNLVNAVCPDPDTPSEVSFEYYLSRIDRLVVKPSREIVVIEGNAGVEPLAPPVKDGDMLIYTLHIPPYTENVKDIKAEFHNNRRFTMKDIGAFENRIKGLEYYVALNALEKNANDSKIFDANGFEKSKYGILVDSFVDTTAQASYYDVGFDNRNKIENGTLKPASLMKTWSLNWRESDSTGNYAVHGTGTKKLFSLTHTSEMFAQQPYATKATTVAGALFGNFKGVMNLYPEFTSDKDTGFSAKVVLKENQGLQEAFNWVNSGFKWISDNNPTWNNDADNPFAKMVDQKWFETKSEVQNSTVYLGKMTYGNKQTTTDRVYINQGAELNMNQIGTSSSEYDVGSFITDFSINPYLKPRSIYFKSTGLRPNKRFYSFFDDTSVDRFTVTPTRVTVTTSSHQLKPGEFCIIGSNNSDVETQKSNYMSDNGNAYNLGYVASIEKGTNKVWIVNENDTSLSGKYIYGLDSNYTAIISSVADHRCGVTQAITTTTITLAADAPSVDISGNTITLVRTTSDFGGYGSTYTISSYNTSTKVATLSSNTQVAERSQEFVYSIGYNSTNVFGAIGGVFYPPNATFRSGERKFRITESFNNTYDADAISFSEKTFVSSGVTVSKTSLIDTSFNVDQAVKLVGNATTPLLQSTTVSSQITNTWMCDPTAQTFFVDESKYPNGISLDSVSIFFSAKDDALPVRVEIRPTVNGAPSMDYVIPNSYVEMMPDDVVVTNSPSVNNDNTKTTFTFDYPIFLKPGLYALVVATESPDYQIWSAEKGASTLNNEYVSVNPYVGTLYKSQNAMEYVPYLNEDMMFEINRCKFNTGTVTLSMQSPRHSSVKYIDKFRVLSNSLEGLSESPTSISYSFISKPYAGTKETSYRVISPDIIYDMSFDTNYTVGSRRKEMTNAGDFTVAVTITSNDDSVSPLISLEGMQLNTWENFIDNGEINEDDFNIINPGAEYSDGFAITVTSSSGTGADVETTVDVDGKVTAIVVNSTGANYLDDFTISYPNSDGATEPVNANIVLNSEFDPSGGPCEARYITKPVQLADGFDAGDLRVFFRANKPPGTELHVFYKLLSGSDSTDFKDRNYQKFVCFNPSTKPNIDPDEYVEYEYRPSLTENSAKYVSDTGVTFDSFKTFSVKIVMTSSDPAVVPSVKDLRIIALPAD